MNDKNRNFLLGAGDQLRKDVLPPKRKPRLPQPYTPEEARKRLAPGFRRAVATFRELPPQALPNGEAVAKLTLHPQFLSKSAFPRQLLAEIGLRAIGSAPTRVKPEKVDRISEAEEEPSAKIYVAATIERFEEISASLTDETHTFRTSVEGELGSIESIEPMLPSDRVQSPESIASSSVLECILHARSMQVDQQIVHAFQDFAERLHLHVDDESTLFASGLCFMAVSGNLVDPEELAYFSFLRRVRPMPRMRPFLPARIARATTGIPVAIPQDSPLDANLIAAVFDTPLPHDHALEHWVDRFDYGVSPYPVAEDNLHGICVTSAASLGALDGSAGDISPYRIHHHGVLGNDPDNSGYLQALKTIQNQVKEKDYKLFNLSFGPDDAIDDGDIDAFTAVIDELLSDGSRLGFIAVGNSGELDDHLQLNRVQPPSDSVNAVSVGATPSKQGLCERADYSCVGPGRLGGRIKPDLLTFGGSLNEPFGCIGSGYTPDRYNTQGTSFSSPAAMRVAGALMASMDTQLTPMAVKALLVHCSDSSDQERREVGHGLIPAQLGSMIECDEYEVRIVYQGMLAAGSYVRHLIPTPMDLKGLVEFDATLCYACKTDPSFPSVYVQAGVEIMFRPHSDRYNFNTDDNGVLVKSAAPRTETLFNQAGVYGQADARHDAHLWDTTLKAHKRKLGSTIQDPVIELHCNRRREGQPLSGSSVEDIPYALVVSLRSRATNDIYNQVRSRFSADLTVLKPKVNIQIRI